LVSALAALANAFERQVRVPVARRLEEGMKVTPEEELVIYRVAQEAMTNVARHAEATQVWLELRTAGDGLILTVGDDGRGLPDGAAASTQGIRGMRERAMLVGATLAVDNRPGGGTVVELSIPR
jgi:two-component system sensor histidine kinase UhpB